MQNETFMDELSEDERNAFVEIWCDIKNFFIRLWKVLKEILNYD